jgi:hypothetical protein
MTMTTARTHSAIPVSNMFPHVTMNSGAPVAAARRRGARLMPVVECPMWDGAELAT